MVYHTCDICEKKFTHKSHYLKHINRKYPCAKIDNTPSIQEVLNKTSHDYSEPTSQKTHTCSQNELDLLKGNIKLEKTMHSLGSHINDESQIYHYEQNENKYKMNKLNNVNSNNPADIGYPLRPVSSSAPLLLRTGWPRLDRLGNLR